MKFRFGPPPDSPEFFPDSSWEALREPGPKTFIWYSLPFGICTSTALIILWFSLTDLQWNDFLFWLFYENSTFEPALLFILLMVAHELIHAFFHPRFGLSSKTIFGIWFAKGALYAHWMDEWGMKRAMTCLLMPFVLLSLFPLVVSLLPSWLVPEFDSSTMALLCYLSVFNGFASCADLAGSRIIFWQIPGKATVRNKGFFTYWQMKEGSCSLPKKGVHEKVVLSKDVRR